MEILRKLWAGWKAFALKLGEIQTTILLSVVYHLTIGPIGLITRLRGNDLLELRRSEGSYWTSLPENERSVERAGKQF